MYTIEDTINQYLKTIGAVVTQPFADIAGTNPIARYTLITHINLPLAIVLDGPFIYPMINVGFLPRQNIAPLFRRLLNLNGKMGGPYFTIGDDNSIGLMITRQQQGLDLAEFRWMLDQISGMYWQNAVGLVQECEIPPQPL